MGQGVHTGVGYLLCRQSLYQFRIYNGYVRSDIKVGQRIFYSGLVGFVITEKAVTSVGSTGGGGDGREFGLLAELREIKGECTEIQRVNVPDTHRTPT